MLIEVCANSVQSAANAQTGGAHRVELCQNLTVGGTTPSNASIRMARAILDISLVVLIRPRAGDFCYSSLEFELMKNNIRFCKENGVDGLALGILDAEGEIDTRRVGKLIDLAKPMQICFHRAFDYTPSPLKSMEQLIDMGIDRILTSGQQINAWEGRELLARLQSEAGGRIGILAGGGINEKNAIPLVQYTGVKQIHFSAKSLKKSPSNIAEWDYYETDIEKVKQIYNLLKNEALL